MRVRVTAAERLERRTRRPRTASGFTQAADLQEPTWLPLLNSFAVAAQAHVKWFFDYNVIKPPLPIGEVLDGTFVRLFLVTVAACYVCGEGVVLAADRAATVAVAEPGTQEAHERLSTRQPVYDHVEEAANCRSESGYEDYL